VDHIDSRKDGIYLEYKMNLLSLIHRHYDFLSSYNEANSVGYVLMDCKTINDSDGYNHLTKPELETLRDNARRLAQAIDMALDDSNHYEKLKPEPMGCQHEFYGPLYLSLPSQYKCKKCGDIIHENR
jgi:hypothetical protein